MNELLAPLLGSLVRWAMALFAAHGLTLAADTEGKLLNGALALAAILWSVWQKYKTAKK